MLHVLTAPLDCEDPVELAAKTLSFNARTLIPTGNPYWVQPRFLGAPTKRRPLRPTVTAAMPSVGIDNHRSPDFLGIGNRKRFPLAFADFQITNTATPSYA
jgi:hypothetical protein